MADDDIIYYGSMTVGEDDTGSGKQTHDMISFDTRLTECIIPNKSVSTYGWFDDEGYSIKTYDHYTVTLGNWVGMCYNFTVTVCVDSSANSDQMCVPDMNTCLLYNED